MAAASRNCVVCRKPIPAERLEVLPDTRTCVRHSPVRAIRCEVPDLPADYAVAAATGREVDPAVLGEMSRGRAAFE